MYCLMEQTYGTWLILRNEGGVSYNEALNTFYGYMASNVTLKNHSGKPFLPLPGSLFRLEPGQYISQLYFPAEK